ncbi:MAG: hypothetical protein HW386_1999 [Gammaproteobacteria bacterium]|nr:hypothetical protein [Gammaproteobacteria bacterium]
MKTHKDLDVWKLAIELARDVYDLTKILPKNEMFGITSQMRRAAISIASNIAEGAPRQTKKEFSQFLHIASGSASEIDTIIEILRVTDLCKPPELNKIQEKNTRISKMLKGLNRKLKSC